MTHDDEAVFAEYVAAQSQRLRDFAYLICGDWHAAEDAVQTALARLFLSWGNLGDRSDLNPYVHRIIVNLIIDRRRRARFRREATSAHVPEGRSVGDAADATSDRMAVLAALAKVPPRQRAGRPGPSVLGRPVRARDRGRAPLLGRHGEESSSARAADLA